jgi:hypothetical protein
MSTPSGIRQYPTEELRGVDDRRISEVLERACRDPGGINRAVLYRQFQRDFVERAIAIPLYYPLFTYVTARTSLVCSLALSPRRTDSCTIRDWTINAG